MEFSIFLPDRSSILLHFSLDFVRWSNVPAPPPRRFIPPRDVHECEVLGGVEESSFCSLFSSSSPRGRRQPSDGCRGPPPRRNG